MTAPTAGEQREQVWLELTRARAAAYPLPPFGHHPNFVGASEAAERLLDYLLAHHLAPGDTVLSYPDYVLKPMRKGLLERGVNVVVPAKHGGGYRYLESGRVNPAKAASIAGAEAEGLSSEDLPPVTVCLVACVAVSPKGEWLGKGYGFKRPRALAELPSFALAHPLMVLESVAEPEGRVLAYATPDGVVRTGK